MAGLRTFRQEQVLWITLNNNEAGQSFGDAEASDLTSTLKDKKNQSIECIVWTTPDNGPFCSGGNLKGYSTHKNKNQGTVLNKKITNSLKLLAEFPARKLAIVEGDCFGGGVELMTCFDTVTATPNAQIGYWQRRMSLTFGWGGGTRSLERLSTSQLRRLYLEARSLSSYEALQLGLIDYIVPNSFLKEWISKWLYRELRLPKEPLAQVQNWFLAISPKNLVQLENTTFEKVWFNPEHKSLLATFSTKDDGKRLSP